MKTVTIVLPSGYADAEEFAKDCGFELTGAPAQGAPKPDEDQEYAETMHSASQLLRLDSVLRHYADTYCEGWCKDAPSDANFTDCGGCRARLALLPDVSALTSTSGCPTDSAHGNKK